VRARKPMINWACLFLFGTSLVVPATVDAQAERRRPGQGADRDSKVVVPPSARPAKPVVRPPAEPAPAGGALEPASNRRRPGDPAPASAIEVPPAEASEPGLPRRPGAAADRGNANPPGAVTAGTGSGPDEAKTARAAGLPGAPKPGPDAEFRMVVVDDRWQLTNQVPLPPGAREAHFPVYSWQGSRSGQTITGHSLLNPYDQNTLKSDRPVWHDWFLNLAAISDTVFEPRRIPTPTGPSGELRGGQLGVIGNGQQNVFNENLTLSVIWFKGETTFRPPDWEFRFVPVLNVNRVEVNQARVLRIDPLDDSKVRTDGHIGIQELFVDKHLRNVSDRYDFDSLRVGIQPFTADFRGFLFQEQQLGVRLFGIRDNNLWQYNLAAFRRLEKDTNSGLNDTWTRLRRDDVFVANLYRQDFPVPGFTSQGVALYNRNREGDQAFKFNNNGQLERPAPIGLEKPRNYDVGYIGYNGDGHLGPVNLSVALYGAFGSENRSIFVDRRTDIRAGMAAAEASLDFDWTRLRLSGLYASADRDPFDGVETGFDAVAEVPIFAGADTSFWIRQNLPLIGGGGVAVSGRNGVLNSLRSSIAQGQSNFTNPGTALAGVGSDHDLTPQFRVSTNLNYLWFNDTRVLEVARNQGHIPRSIGLDASVATIWRPFFTQNIVFRGSAAMLVPGSGYKALYGDQLGYSVLLNLILAY
jgi:hypothetical protein